MKQNSQIWQLLVFQVIFFELPAIPVYSQDGHESDRSKSIFIEFAGSGVSIISANFDFRFLKGHRDGLGMRIGIGGESYKTEPIIGYGETKTKLFTVPLELNYILGNKRLSFELGYSLTYISESENSSFRLTNPYYTYSHESGKLIVSYMPAGIRFKPRNNGFMLKFNAGPLWNYSAPNIFYYDKIQFWAGFALGYSFY